MTNVWAQSTGPIFYLKQNMRKIGELVLLSKIHCPFRMQNSRRQIAFRPYVFYICNALPLSHCEPASSSSLFSDTFIFTRICCTHARTCVSVTTAVLIQQVYEARSEYPHGGNRSRVPALMFHKWSRNYSSYASSRRRAIKSAALLWISSVIAGHFCKAETTTSR